MRAALALAERVAAFPWNVVLTGSTGTGKGLLARYIHARSRPDRAWVSVTAGGLVDSLIGSQINGHMHGSFTGTRGDAKGALESASDGTLFLDEVQHLSLQAQVSLLEPMAERTVIRTGAYRPLPLQCRFIFGTGVPLDDLVRDGCLIPDLRHRMGALEIDVPALANRRGDILPLADHFLPRLVAEARLPGIPRWTPGAARALLLHFWPGNVRELGERLKRALVHSCGGDFEAHDLGLPEAPEADLGRVLDRVERGEVARYALHVSGGLRHEAAARLGIGRNTLLRWLETSGDEPTYPEDAGWRADPDECTTGIAGRSRNGARRRGRVTSRSAGTIS
jgi:DNA-binding NtrC family response regulator